MKKIRHILAILMTVTMITSGGGMDGFAALTYAAEDQATPAVTQEQEVSENDAAEQAESEVEAEETVKDADDAVKDEPSESSDTELDLEAEDGDLIYELEAEIKLSDKSNWIVTAVYGNEAGIPEGAELYIEEIDKKDHNAYLKNTIKALKWTENEQAAYARFLNISIKSNGKVVKPAANVEIMITPDDVDKEDLKKMQVVRFDNKKSDAKAKELKCEVTKDGEVVFETDEFADFGFVISEDSRDSAEGETENAEEDPALVHKTLKADKVRLEGMMPEDAKATAKDASRSKAVKTIKLGDGTALAAYDIEIRAEGEEYQPDADHPITVQINNTSIKEGSNLSVWHIRDNGKKEEIKDFTVSNGKVSFEATGFSVYVVIDHEEGTVVTPRVQFHFIDPDATEHGTGSDIYYEADPYSFRNKSDDTAQNTQTTQILKDGESLEMIEDPGNITDPKEKDFYGWYVVDPYTDSGSSDSDKLYYTWPADPDKITFESPISIEASNVAIGTTVNWSLHGVSGSGKVDKDGNVHVYLAPLYENFIFVNFMLRPRNSSSQGASSLMTRKMIVMGSADSAEVKISDVRSNNSDSVHLIFTGWEYYAGTGDPATDTDNWIQKPTVDYSGAEIKDPGKDGVYISLSDLDDQSSVDLYPIFVEARWADFVSGPSGSGASYVSSRFLESWGPATPPDTPEVDGKNVISVLDQPTRKGYDFGGWYAFAVVDPETGEIINKEEDVYVSVNYLAYVGDSYSVQTATIKTKAIQISDGDGNIVYDGTYSLNTGNGSVDLFSASDGKLKFHDAIDRLKLYADWAPGESKVTVVYWTENAQDKDTVVSQNEKENYTAGAVKTISTTELSSKLGRTFTSGSVVTLEDLQNYVDDTCGILDNKYLGEVGAVSKDEAKFFELNTSDDTSESLSDQQVVINGDGSTVFNVYFERMTFKLVFHIGRDGYVKNGGHQKTDDKWDGNWIEFMYKDNKVRELGYPTPGGEGRDPAQSQAGIFKMTYGQKTYTSGYVTTNENVMGNYVPSPETDPNDENVYVISAKYGAYIGDRWPTPTNPNFTFEDAADTNKTMYIWAAYYGSLYCRIANERSTEGNPQGANPDINGVYSYMSAELCSNRAGDDIINDAKVHHLVAYYGNSANQNRFKQYHILYEAIDGTYDPNSITPKPGTDYAQYNLTTWSEEHTVGDKSEIIGHDFLEFPSESPKPIISNLEPKFQLSEALDGYDLVYSCYDPVQRANPDISGQKDFHIYFFYKPKKYTLTFKYETGVKSDDYYYTQSLADANKYAPPEKEGYEFLGWYTNEAGIGDPFDFANETMPTSNIVLYPVLRVRQYSVLIDPNGGVIDHIHYAKPPDDIHDNYANNFGVIGSGYNTSQATYFTADYGTPVGEYSIQRNYIMLSEKELDPSSSNYYTGTKYYYINTQFHKEYDGDWGLPPDLRNAVYMTEEQLRCYYNYYQKVATDDLDYYSGVTVLDYNAFVATYTSFPEHPYRPLNPGSEKYAFMGWYQVYDDGSEAEMPYNFNDPVKGTLKLRAKWRLEGGYYVKYNPVYFAEDNQGNVTEIDGTVEQWTDPADPNTQLYVDGSKTHVLRAPTKTDPEWVFRGWRVVRQNGTIEYQGETYPKWEPIQFDDNDNPVYYQPGDDFIIDASLVSEIPEQGSGAIINMQAYYEPVESAYRRPEVTNLTLDANSSFGGYVDSTVGTLPALPGSGSTAISGNKILFGDIQSEIALHLFKYATEKSHYGETGKEFFKNYDKYLLLGFDPQSNPESIVKVDPRDDSQTGAAQPYIPNYPVDSVISVQRTDVKTLYAIWEPMLYATFVNTTDDSITVTLSSEVAGAVSVVNQVTGEFDRKQTTNTITIPAKSGDKNGEIKVVFPGAKARDTIKATAVNDHSSKKMTVKGTFNNLPYGDGSEDVIYGGNVTYEGDLKPDKDGIFVEYTEKPDAEIIYDVNGGNWTASIPPYEHVNGDIYALEESNIPDTGVYEPSEPTHGDGKIFVGWTTNADIAEHMDFSSEEAVAWGNTTITPDAGSNVLDKIREEYLWDFSQNPPFDQILYAVWSDAVTVTFDMTYTGSKLHTWEGPATESTDAPYVYYRSSQTDEHVTYTMAKGDKVPKPNNPSAHSEKPTWSFINWLNSNNTTKPYRSSTTYPTEPKVVNNTFDFSQHITENKTLVTSWTTNRTQTYTFTVENNVVNGNENDEFAYSVAVSGEKVFGKIGGVSSNRIGPPDELWGRLDNIKLKNNEKYTVRVSVKQSTIFDPNVFSIEIEVIDKEGTTVKSGQVIYCEKNKYPNFCSDYLYTLTISQTGKESGYTTELKVKDEEPNDGSIKYSTDDTSSFTFTSKHNGTTKNDQCVQTFGGEPMNDFAAGDNSLTIVFTNTGTALVAPTGYSSYLWPLIWMLLLGMFMWTAMTYMRKRRSLDGYAMEAAGIDSYDEET